MKRFIYFFLSVILAFSLLPTTFVKANNENTRVATIDEAEGLVMVYKAGGKLGLQAYPGMKLLTGDIITTGSNSSASLVFSNGAKEDDQITLSEHSSLTVYKLKNAGATITKTKLNRGNAVVSVSSIEKEQDQFLFELQQTQLNIRGTNFQVSVTPDGNSYLQLFSGIIRLVEEYQNNNTNPIIYPTQQILFTEDGPFTGHLSNESIESLLQSADQSVISTIINNLQKIKEENDQLIQSLNGNNDLEPNPVDVDLDRFSENIKNLVGAILKKANEAGKITPVDAENLFNQLNIDSSQNFDLDNLGRDLPPIDEQPSKAVEDRKKQLEKEKLAQIESRDLQAKQQAMLDELKRKKEEQEKAMQEEMDRRKAAAEEAYLKNLAEIEKERFLRERELLQNRPTPPVTPPVPPAPPVIPPDETDNPPVTPPDETEDPPGEIEEPPGEPEDEYAWNGITVPFTLFVDGEEPFEIVYDAEAKVYKVAEPIHIEEGRELLLQPNDFDGEVTVTNVKVNFETRWLDEEGEEVYRFFLEPGVTSYELVYRISHDHYGAKTFVVKIEMAQNVEEWQDIREPLFIQFEDSYVNGEVEYDFDSYNEEIRISSLPVSGEASLHFKAVNGLTITSFEGASEENGVFTLTLEEPIEEKEDIFTLVLSHETFGEMTITLSVITEKGLPFTLLKGNVNQTFEEYEAISPQYKASRHIFEEGQLIAIKPHDATTEMEVEVNGESIQYSEEGNYYFFLITEEMVEELWGMIPFEINATIDGEFYSYSLSIY